MPRVVEGPFRYLAGWDEDGAPGGGPGKDWFVWLTWFWWDQPYQRPVIQEWEWTHNSDLWGENFRPTWEYHPGARNERYYESDYLSSGGWGDLRPSYSRAPLDEVTYEADTRAVTCRRYAAAGRVAVYSGGVGADILLSSEYVVTWVSYGRYLAGKVYIFIESENGYFPDEITVEATRYIAKKREVPAVDAGIPDLSGQLVVRTITDTESRPYETWIQVDNRQALADRYLAETVLTVAEGVSLPHPHRGEYPMELEVLEPPAITYEGATSGPRPTTQDWLRLKYVAGKLRYRSAAPGVPDRMPVGFAYLLSIPTNTAPGRWNYNVSLLCTFCIATLDPTDIPPGGFSTEYRLGTRERRTWAGGIVDPVLSFLDYVPNPYFQVDSLGNVTARPEFRDRLWCDGSRVTLSGHEMRVHLHVRVTGQPARWVWTHTADIFRRYSLTGWVSAVQPTPPRSFHFAYESEPPPGQSHEFGARDAGRGTSVSFGLTVGAVRRSPRDPFGQP